MAFELIEELSQPEFAAGTQHIYYLTSDNGLTWIAKPSTVGSTLTEGVDFFSIRSDKKMWDTVNMIIRDCGENPFGNTILAWDYDVVSAAKG